MRGAAIAARLTAAVVVLAALGIVALAARSGRTETVTPISTVSASPTYVPPTSGPYRQRETEAARGTDTSGAEMADELVWVIALFMLWLAVAALAVWATVFRPRLHLPRLPAGRPAAGRRPPVPDAVGAARLTAAVDAGLRGLAEGGPGEGVIACWVLLERAAADAGTHRALPDTPSELAGRLIDRHDVSSAPLLRLADLYREARYSRHTLPESVRTEARAALEQIRAELAASPTASASPPGDRAPR